jgi:hypothetical protein
MNLRVPTSKRCGKKNYEGNILRLLPNMAEELNDGCFSVTGVFVVKKVIRFR